MKLAVCGKGGSGKSTVTVLLSKELEARGKKVLVIDCDESNYGLHRQLGLELPEDFSNFYGGKKKIMPRMLFTMQKYQFVKGAAHTADIPKQYYSQKGKIKLIASGKIHEANEGCACPMNNVMMQYVSKLELEPDEVVIMDTEAGIEHFGRGLDNAADAVLMVVDSSYESIQLSKKVHEMCKAMGKPIYFVLNKMTEESADVARRAMDPDAKIIACLYTDAELQKAGLLGEPLEAGNPQAAAIADALL